MTLPADLSLLKGCGLVVTGTHEFATRQAG